MDAIYIPQLAKAVDATETLEFKEHIDGLDSLTPVQGVLQVKHQSTFIQVKAKAWTIVTLTCDRTLEQFNHRLAIDTEELIWLAEPIPAAKYAKETEVDFEDLGETLSPNGYFKPATWLYEQLSLAIPLQKIAPDAPELTEIVPATPTIDKRWAALQTLHIADPP